MEGFIPKSEERSVFRSPEVKSGVIFYLEGLIPKSEEKSRFLESRLKSSLKSSLE